MAWRAQNSCVSSHATPASTDGRTGRETITAVLTAFGLILMGCAGLGVTLADVGRPIRGELLLYFGFMAVCLAQVALNLNTYTYNPVADSHGYDDQRDTVK